MAQNRSETHPVREALKDFGMIALVLGALVIGAELLSE